MFLSKNSLMPITISLSFLLDIKAVSIGNELWKNMKIKIREQLLKPKLPEQILKVEVIGTTIENQNY